MGFSVQADDLMAAEMPRRPWSCARTEGRLPPQDEVGRARTPTQSLSETALPQQSRKQGHVVPPGSGAAVARAPLRELSARSRWGVLVVVQDLLERGWFLGGRDIDFGQDVREALVGDVACVAGRDDLLTDAGESGDGEIDFGPCYS